MDAGSTVWLRLLGTKDLEAFFILLLANPAPLLLVSVSLVLSSAPLGLNSLVDFLRVKVLALSLRPPLVGLAVVDWERPEGGPLKGAGGGGWNVPGGGPLGREDWAEV